MNKVLEIILIISFAVLGIGFLSVPSTFAQNDNLIVQFEPDPLFTGTNFLPGQNATGTARVTNNSGQPQRIATEAINYPGFSNPDNVPAGDLSRALSIIIREEDGSDLYGGTTGEKTLFNFYENGETYLSDLPTGDTEEYEYEITFPSVKENEWQGATTTFDILIGFQGTGGQVSPGTPPSGGGVPGLTIQYEKDFYIGTTTTKITWFTSYNSTSRVIYDTQSGVFNLNNLPNYGYAFSTIEQDIPVDINGVTYHEVWLTDLQQGTTYYFRCVSHGSFAVSVEHSFTTLGVKEEITPSQPEITPPVGEEIEKPEELTQKPSEEISEGLEEKGAIVETEEGKKLVGEEKKSFGEIFAKEGFLAAIGAMPFNLKIILIIVGIIALGLIVLWLIKKRKKI